MKSEAHLPNLPVDYYDNDDGFWDEHIEEKLQIYYDNQPLSNRDKKYFTHWSNLNCNELWYTESNIILDHFNIA